MTAVPDVSVEQAPRFHAERPTDLRRATPWHRLSYIVEELPRRLRALASDVQPPPGGAVLDYGCADLPYRSFFPADINYLAADLSGNPQATVEIAADGTVPVPDAS